MKYSCKTLSRLLALFLLLKRNANNRLWIHQWSSNVIITSSGGDTVTSCDLLFSTRRCFREKTPLTCWLWSSTNTSTTLNEQKSTNTGQLSAWQKPGERPSKEIHIQSTDVEHATMVTFTEFPLQWWCITAGIEWPNVSLSLSFWQLTVHYSGDVLLRGLFGVM